MRPLWLVSIVFFLSATTALPNDASYGGDGATVFALKENRVRMVKEEIRIREAGDGSWKADCEFTFENLTPTKLEVQMGFPDWHELGDGGQQWAIREFKVEVAGKSLPVQHKPKDKAHPAINRIEYEGVYLWRVAFEPKAKVVVRNSYLFRGLSTNGPFSACLGNFAPASVKDAFWKIAPKAKGGWDYEDGLCKAVSYIVTTGLTWNGPIGDAHISMTLDSKLPPHTAVIIPPATEVKDGVVHWRFRNWTPSTDLAILYARPLFAESSEATAPGFDTVAQAKAWLRYARKNGFDKATVLRSLTAVPPTQKEIRKALADY